MRITKHLIFILLLLLPVTSMAERIVCGNDRDSAISIVDADNHMRGSNHSPPDSMVVESVYAYLDPDCSSLFDNYLCKASLYLKSDHGQECYTAERSIAKDGAEAWYGFEISEACTLSTNDNIIITIWCDDCGGSPVQEMEFFYDTQSPVPYPYGYDEVVSYGSWEDPWTVEDSLLGRDYCVYCSGQSIGGGESAAQIIMTRRD